MTEQEVMRFNDQDLERRLQRAKEEQELLQKEVIRREKFKIERKLISLKDQLNNTIKNGYLRLVFKDLNDRVTDNNIDDIEFTVTVEKGELVLRANVVNDYFDYD